MPNKIKISFLTELENKFGELKKLPNSQSLYEIGDGLFRILIRYSKIHNRNQAFYGIRKKDLKYLAGFNSFIVFLCDAQEIPLFVPFSEYEEVFNKLEPASDGQIKTSIYHKLDATELYISNLGRFNIDAFLGWDYLNEQIDFDKIIKVPSFSHSQMQTLIGSIGKNKGFEIWIPTVDRSKLDWGLTTKYQFISDLPTRYNNISSIIKEVDVIWIQRGSGKLKSMFEVEHSTPIYSGLLRFNDLHLTEPELKPAFNIVSNQSRKTLFIRQINRPTFRISGLSDLCSFLEYKNVFGWYNRINS